MQGWKKSGVQVEKRHGEDGGVWEGTEMGQVLGPVSTCRCPSSRVLKNGVGSSVLENLRACKGKLSLLTMLLTANVRVLHVKRFSNSLQTQTVCPKI